MVEQAIDRSVHVGGLVRVLTPAQAKAQTQAPAAPALQVEALAAHVQKCWHAARQAKINTVEPRMLSAVRRRRGEYDPGKLMQIRETGGSEIFMMLSSNKCRAASSWLRDTYSGVGAEKAWAVRPTPEPEFPPTMMQEALQEATASAQKYILATGEQPSPAGMREMLLRIRDRMMAAVHEDATDAAARMERFMEDQLAEGGFREAFSAFLDDLTTFPTAILKGPVLRRKPALGWAEDGMGGWKPVVETKLVREWERVDPFRFYPSPYSTTIEDGYTIEHHPLSRRALTELIGVEGYDETKIREVLDEYGRGGLRNWLTSDAQRNEAEGRIDPQSTGVGDGDPRIDALQFFGNVSGKMLREWGMSAEQIPDEAREYDCEVWLIGRVVIKAMLNPDPLARKPYYAASYESIPGMFWGNSVVDLIADCQDACNAAARALMNNMGIASGPQVSVNVQRMPQGERLTTMHPWKIWQFESDPFGSTAPPLDFFQPQSNAQELMAVYEKFSVLADEFSGIPRYMTGDASVSGAGRTASGMSMLMSNAGKTIKQVIANVDTRVVEPALYRLHYLNMLDTDVDQLLKVGDIKLQASGARALVMKEAAQVRRNEYLQIALNSPVAQQVLGMEGVAELLREGAKSLDMPVDRVVPPLEVLKTRWMAQAQAQQAQQGQQAPAPGGGEQLMDGTPTTDNFAPPGSLTR